MNLKERLVQDLKQAMKDNDVVRKNTIQQIRAQVLLAEKNKKMVLSDREVEDVIVKERKLRADALAQFEKAQRKDLIEQTQKEIMCINNYLPQPMSDYELDTAVREVISNEGIIDMKMLGYAIKKCKEQFGNRVSGKQLSDKVKEVIAENEQRI